MGRLVGTVGLITVERITGGGGELDEAALGRDEGGDETTLKLEEATLELDDPTECEAHVSSEDGTVDGAAVERAEGQFLCTHWHHLQQWALCSVMLESKKLPILYNSSRAKLLWMLNSLFLPM